MHPSEQELQDTHPLNGGGMLSRRNLPRASHACQRCRVKKARCDQKQPCANCVRHAVDCEYGVRRRSARNTTAKIANASIVRSQHLSASCSTDGQHEQRELEMPDTYQTSPIATIASSQGPATQVSDVLGDVNEHTNGTEFYGTSSNFVLLNQFFNFARSQVYLGHAGQNGTNTSIAAGQPPQDVGIDAPGDAGQQRRQSPAAALSQGRVSIINLLSNEEALSPPSRPKTPIRERDRDRVMPSAISPGPHRTGFSDYIDPRISTAPPDARQMTEETQDYNVDANSRPDSSRGRSRGSYLHPKDARLEREYVRIFLDNLHHLHPVVDPFEFTTRCEQQVWNEDFPIEMKRRAKHFFALYNIIVAVGALIAGRDVTRMYDSEIKTCMARFMGVEDISRTASSQSLSRMYFRASRELLGDVFEVCSLESAQTLLLMSLYCQNTHKPHACYMYCGHAVRTALAIGLTNESTSSSTQDRKAARRTWWCIYSHEIDMSCSSGRRDSLGKPRNYQIPFPVTDTAHQPPVPELEPSKVTMINEMVSFAAILRKVSKSIYHDAKGLTLAQKSVIATDLDLLLSRWKDQLPAELNFEKASLREEEWAAKQSFVLHLRYLNARIVIHRPFLAPTYAQPHSPATAHMEHCLQAARETIRIMYEAYTHRHYFRTWWYNATYTLYAGMIVLYVIMLDYTTASSYDLLKDANKAQQILQSMSEVPVARRSAELIREGLEAAQACVESNVQSNTNPAGNENSSRLNVNNLINIDGISSGSAPSQPYQATEPSALLASLIDPYLLQDFTVGSDFMSGFNMSPFDGGFDDILNPDHLSQHQQGST